MEQKTKENSLSLNKNSTKNIEEISNHSRFSSTTQKNLKTQKHFMSKKQTASHSFATKIVDNKRFMICQNSIPDGKYWQGKLCDTWSKVGLNTTSVLCYKCSVRLAGDPEIGAGYKSSGKPRGWQFMKEYVDEQGNVYHKGVEH